MARNTNGYRNSGRGSGNRYDNRRRSAANQKQGCIPSLAVTALAVFIGTVILFIAAFSMLNPGGKKAADTSSAQNVSNTDVNSATIVPFEDAENTSSDEVLSDEASSNDVSSAVNHPSFKGTWQKTDVYENAKATITVSNQTDDGFDFTFKIWANSKTSSISGTASFTKTNAAVYKKGNASITFECGSKYLSVYHSGSNSTLGFSNAAVIDGKFTKGTPNYYKAEEANTYDYDVYKSAAAVKALKATLSANDYELYQEMMSKGLKSPIPYERTVDKNGKKINVDSELNCVKYYANLSTIGMDMIFICSNSGKIYVLFYDAEEMRYYTNDKNYASKMPKSFQTTAESTGMTPIYK